MSTEQEILKKLNRLESLVSQLIDEKKKSVWVKVSVIKKKTGWTNNEMRQAREARVLKFKRDKGVWYDLNSLPQNLLKTA